MLISVLQKTDENGYGVPGKEYRHTVFSEQKSATRTEFYKALAINRHVTSTYVVNHAEYVEAGVRNEKGKLVLPSLIEDDGTRYRILRAYGVGDDLELNCEEL